MGGPLRSRARMAVTAARFPPEPSPATIRGTSCLAMSPHWPVISSAVAPPSMTNSAPVVEEDSSDARNCALYATLSTDPVRPSSTLDIDEARPSIAPANCAIISVSIGPGCIEGAQRNELEESLRRRGRGAESAHVEQRLGQHVAYQQYRSMITHQSFDASFGGGLSLRLCLTRSLRGGTNSPTPGSDSLIDCMWFNREKPGRIRPAREAVDMLSRGFAMTLLKLTLVRHAQSIGNSNAQWPSRADN